MILFRRLGVVVALDLAILCRLSAIHAMVQISRNPEAHMARRRLIFIARLNHCFLRLSFLTRARRWRLHAAFKQA